MSITLNGDYAGEIQINLNSYGVSSDLWPSIEVGVKNLKRVETCTRSFEGWITVRPKFKNTGNQKLWEKQLHDLNAEIIHVVVNAVKPKSASKAKKQTLSSVK